MLIICTFTSLLQFYTTASVNAHKRLATDRKLLIGYTPFDTIHYFTDGAR